MTREQAKKYISNLTREEKQQLYELTKIIENSRVRQEIANNGKTEK